MADFKYTMKDLSRIIDRTPARIYDYFKEDKEYYFSESSRRKDSKKGYLYSEAVLESLKKRLLIENGVGQQDFFPADGESPDSIAPHNEEASRLSAEIARLSAELEDMKGKNAALQSDFDKAEGERVELLRQNGLKDEQIQHLLLLLSQEKAEKQALLPAPRRSIGERIRSIFKKEGKTE